MQKSRFVTFIILILGIGFFIWWQFGRAEFSLPQGEVEKTETIELADGAKKEIMVTDDVKHSIPLNEIRSGGPPKDGIPSIDNPKFISIQEAQKTLGDNEVGLAIDMEGVQRFYPFQILVFHEIVNDTVNGKRLLITYCPLCLTGIVFDPLVQGARVEFGTSGLLWNSNLVMYDRRTDTLWSQVLGEAIAGEMTGTKLKILPSDVVKFGEWKKIYPSGQVLSQDTGAIKNYGIDPYGDYYTTPGVYFALNNEDDRLSEKAIIVGVEFDRKAKAYDVEAIKKIGMLEETFAGRNLVIRHEPDIDAVRIYEKLSDGSLERINPVYGFWFSWAAVWPDTELYK